MDDLSSNSSSRGRPRDSRCSRLCLLWPWQYIRKGFNKSLPRAAMPELPIPLLSSTLVPTAFLAWQKERLKPKPSIVSLFFTLHWTTFSWGITFGAFQGFLNASARPLILNYLIIAFMPDAPAYAGPEYVAMLLTIFGVVVLLEGWLKVIAGNTLSTEFGALILGWLVPLIHHKSARICRIETADKEEETDGNVDQTHRAATSEVALVAKDSIDTVSQFGWISNFPQCIVGIVAGTSTLIFLLGLPSIIGMTTMIISLSLNRLFANCGGRMAASEMAAGDSRLTVMREIVESIVPLKYLTWEEPYLNLIDRKREIECHWLYKMRLLTVTSVTIGRVSPVLAACATYTYMGLNDYPLTPNIIFASLAIFNALRMPLITIPLNLIQLKVMAVSFRRITGFLVLAEHKKCPEPKDNNVAVEFCNATFTWSPAIIPEDINETKRSGSTSSISSDTARSVAAAAAAGASNLQDDIQNEDAPIFKLSNINLTVQKGSLVGIVGRVGCGKSTLLSSLLGEVQLESGMVTALEDVGYVPQKPFILSGTVLENIIMGREFNQILLDAALIGSDFNADLKLLPGGLETEIGERGMTLSGGQKQRLAIARAIYKKPDLLVVDDALAAVDGKVATKIFTSICLNRCRKDKLTTIIALNQLSFLSDFDHIVFLVDGKIKDQGTYNELITNKNELFMQMIQSTGSSESLDDVEQSPIVQENNRKVLHSNSNSKDPEIKMLPTLLTVEDVIVENDVTNVSEIKKKEEQQEEEQEIESKEIEIVAEQDEAADKETEKTTMKEKGKLVDDDERRSGALSSQAIKHYLSAAGGWCWLIPGALLGTIAYGLMAANDLWLAGWVSPNNTLSTVQRASVYVGLSLGQSVAIWTLSMWNNCATNRASRAVHHDCINRLLHAPSSWFQKTPSGRIMSRFSGDMAMMDKMFAFISDDIMQFTFVLLSLLITICYILPEMVIILFVGLIFYGFGVVAVDRTNREAKREANLALSPVITTLAETISGRPLIHAMKFESFFEKKEILHTENWSRFTHFSSSAVQSGSMLTNIIAFFFSVAAAVLVYYKRNDLDDIALIGVALNYSFVLPYFLGLYSIMTMLLFNGVTSVERVLDFITGDLPQERPWVLPNDPPRSIFPKTGTLEFKHVNLKYRKELPNVIENINCTIQNGETVGIVGRTGAGKSSLIVGLFRIVDRPLIQGEILVDGVNLGDIGLQTARRALAIIPQTPLLLSPGSIGHNIDPFGKHSIDKIQECMRKVGLDPRNIEDEGSELSSGQQQLLALARLLLFDHVPKIIVMDEPTANIDSVTDDNIQRVIKEEFQGITMLTIAHRLNTVIGNDKMMVMDAGKVAEFGSPFELLNKENGRLSKMIGSLGKESANRLRKGAQDAADEKQKKE